MMLYVSITFNTVTSFPAYVCLLVSSYLSHMSFKIPLNYKTIYKHCLKSLDTLKKKIHNSNQLYRVG